MSQWKRHANDESELYLEYSPFEMPLSKVTLKFLLLYLFRFPLKNLKCLNSKRSCRHLKLIKVVIQP